MLSGGLGTTVGHGALHVVLVAEFSQLTQAAPTLFMSRLIKLCSILTKTRDGTRWRGMGEGR